MPPANLFGDRPKVRVPQAGTLRRYGLTAEDWLEILARQGGVCAVCRDVPRNGRLCTDHDHVKGWKNLPPEERKRHVRGLLCFWCNSRYVGRGITTERARRVYEFLLAHDRRKGKR